MSHQSSLKVCIAHSGRQHSHQTAFALQEAEMLQRFYTTLWYKPNQFPYSLLELFGDRARGMLKKRYFEGINPALVEQIPFHEIRLQLLRLFSHGRYGRFIYKVNSSFDAEVARRVRSIDCDVFVGYETSCMETFRICKERNIPRILDQAQVHHSAHKILESSGIDPFHGDQTLSSKINHRKDEELGLADLIFVPSSYSHRVLVAAGNDPEKIVRIEYGFDPQVFKPAGNRNERGPFIALFVGSVTRRKGIDVLLKAWSDLKLRDAELIIAGGVSDASGLLAGYEGNVRYISFVSPAKLADLYRGADLFILPSLMDSFGIVVLEAMACGTPVIVTNTTGACDLVRDSLDGFVIPPSNQQSLMEKIRFFYENRTRASEMGMNAAAQAAPYTWQRYRERVRNEIESFCKIKAGRSAGVSV